MSGYILEMNHITKEFSGVKALDDVNLKVTRGEIHAICGENGAGKSTLMNVLSGVYPFGTYSGDIVYDGEICKFHNIKESEKKGIDKGNHYRNRRNWTAREVSRMKMLLKRGLTHIEVAEELGRTLQAVDHKIMQLKRIRNE